MGENIKLTSGKMFINGCGFSEFGIVESIEPENVIELDESGVFIPNSNSEWEGTIECTLPMINPAEFWCWVYTICPNNRVKHLMLNGKTQRVRFKNYQRAFDIVYKAFRKNA